MVVRKLIFYAGAFLILITVLQELGIELTPLLGAAGIAGIAVGFTAQTSISNLISGIFLISEKPFAVGDLIRISEKLGLVLSIDLLSIKIRTFDNLYIRIPNEKILNTELTNITRFTIRRMDIHISVAYKEDLRKVKDVLWNVANNNPYVMDEPEPFFIIKNFGDSGIEFLFGIWFQKSDYVNLKNSIMVEIKEAFDKERIEIPFPHRTLYIGEASKPLDVLVKEKELADTRTGGHTRGANKKYR
jgi:small-conductance mechanosensitive channel